jgi:hypothetical protein
MKRALLGGGVVAAVLLFAGQQAKAEWLCGENRCVWVSYDVDEPACAGLGTAGQAELLLEAGRLRPVEAGLPVIP